MVSCSLAKAYKDGIASYKHWTSPQLHMLMYATSSLSSEKCNMRSFNKLLCKILLWCTAFMMFMNAHDIFTWLCLKVTSCLHPSILGPPSCNNIRFSIRGEYFVLKSNIFWSVPHNITMCKLPWFLSGWQGSWWHLYVHMGKLMFLLNVACVLPINNLFWVSFPPT
jgi:hypothetical protein